MEELREKAKRSIIMKKPSAGQAEGNQAKDNIVPSSSSNPVTKDIGASSEGQQGKQKPTDFSRLSCKIANPNIGAIHLPFQLSNRDIGSNPESVGNGHMRTHASKFDRGRDGNAEVSERIKTLNDSEKDVKKDLSRKESRRSTSRHRGSSRHKESSRHRDRSKHRESSRHRSSRHRSSRHRDSSRRRRKHRRKSSSGSSRGDSYERRRKRRRRDRKRRSSSSGSRDRHRSRSRKHRRSRHRSPSSSSSGSSSSGSSSRSGSRPLVKKNDHPYFSKMAKMRRKRFQKEKQERFWDGFQWVSKESLELATKDPTKNMKSLDDASGANGKIDEKIVTGKDLRRVVATNLPLDYGINQEDLANFIIMKCKEKGDDILFRSIFLNTEQNSGIIECMEKDMTDLLIKLDGETLLGHTLRFTKVADESGFIHGGDSEKVLQDSAQLTAQAAAIVSSRLRGLQGKSGASNTLGSNLNLIGDSFSASKPSRIIKVSNVFDRYSTMTAQQFEELYEDMEEEMLNFGEYKRIKIIRNGEERIGAEVGSVFVEFNNESEAKAAKEGLKGRVYDGREIKVIFIQEPLYKDELHFTDV